MVDLTVLVDAPDLVRRGRLAAREEPAFLEAWRQRWDVAEAHYFHHVRPPDSFDIIIETDRGVMHDRRPREAGPPLLPNECRC